MTITEQKKGQLMGARQYRMGIADPTGHTGAYDDPRYAKGIVAGYHDARELDASKQDERMRRQMFFVAMADHHTTSVGVHKPRFRKGYPKPLPKG